MTKPCVRCGRTLVQFAFIDGRRYCYPACFERARRGDGISVGDRLRLVANFIIRRAAAPDLANWGERCTTCGQALDSPPCSKSPDGRVSGHTGGGGSREARAI